ncbi:MAG: 2-polyprenylphenol 6-hydroxylase, partial [Proteobacteria bacterium]|nr:2-polyprenylphenol 6-hydroxylase [Pseudomonadota bacterium]
QPQLLLLQKTLVVAEGVGRKLNPEVNMWEMARPLIEDWVVENLGPEARIRDTATGVLASLERLPELLANVEAGAAMLAEGGLKLHPETVSALAGHGRDRRRAPAVWWLIAALLGVILLLLL